MRKGTEVCVRMIVKEAWRARVCVRCRISRSPTFPLVLDNPWVFAGVREVAMMDDCLYEDEYEYYTESEVEADGEEEEEDDDETIKNVPIR